jgi:hypothetical protein
MAFFRMVIRTGEPAFRAISTAVSLTLSITRVKPESILTRVRYPARVRAVTIPEERIPHPERVVFCARTVQEWLIESSFSH